MSIKKCCQIPLKLYSQNRFWGGFGSIVFSFYYYDIHMNNIMLLIYNSTRKIIHCVKINFIASIMSNVSGDRFTHKIN